MSESPLLPHERKAVERRIDELQQQAGKLLGGHFDPAELFEKWLKIHDEMKELRAKLAR